MPVGMLLDMAAYVLHENQAENCSIVAAKSEEVQWRSSCKGVDHRASVGSLRAYNICCLERRRKSVRVFLMPSQRE